MMANITKNFFILVWHEQLYNGWIGSLRLFGPKPANPHAPPPPRIAGSERP